MRKLLSAFILSQLAAALVATSAFAVGPIETVNSYPGKRVTYSATIVGLVPASAATDFFTITGSATKTVALRSVKCSGTSTTAGSLIIQEILRSTADTGGTSTAPVAVPNDSNDAAATAVVAAYTANPSALGTSVGPIDATLLGLNLVSTAAAPTPAVFAYTPDDVRKAPSLHGVTQVLALNANAATFPAGSALSCNVVWTEN